MLILSNYASWKHRLPLRLPVRAAKQLLIPFATYIFQTLLNIKSSADHDPNSSMIWHSSNPDSALLSLPVPNVSCNKTPLSACGQYPPRRIFPYLSEGSFSGSQRFCGHLRVSVQQRWNESWRGLKGSITFRAQLSHRSRLPYSIQHPPIALL